MNFKRIAGVVSSLALSASLLLSSGAFAATSGYSSSPVTSVYAGTSHALALKANGELLSWGSNTAGELGLTSKDTSKHPFPEVIALGVTAASAGDHYSLYVKNENVFGIGENANGASGSLIATLTPVLVKDTNDATLSNIAKVYAGTSYSVALAKDGKAFLWGNGSEKATAIVSPGGLAITSIVNSDHFLALLLSNGTVFVGGDPLGSSFDPTIVEFVEKFSNISSITGGDKTLFALKKDTTVAAYGDNTYGQLGNNTTTSSSTPVVVKNVDSVPITKVVEITSSGNTVFARTSDPGLYAWGKNNAGQLGLKTNTNTLLATANIITVLLRDFVQFHTATSSSFTIASFEYSGVGGFGDNNFGQLGEDKYYNTDFYMGSVTDALGNEVDGDVLTATTTMDSLSFSTGTLSPAFSKNTYDYKLKVPGNVPSLSLLAKTTNPKAHLTVNDKNMTNNILTTVAMSTSLKTITIGVTAQDGFNHDTYSVAIERIPLFTYIKVAIKAPAYNNASSTSGISTSISPGTVKSYENKNGFYRVDTIKGQKWISESNVLTVGKKSVRSVRTLELFDGVGIKMKKPTLVKAAVFASFEHVGTWYHIHTWLGDKWVQITDVVKPISLKINLKSQTYLKDEVAGANRKESLRPQTITAYEQVGSYYHIHTWLGDKWVYVPTVIIPTIEKVIMKVNFQLYNDLNLKSGSGKYSKATTLTAFEKSGNWYHVHTWLGDKWVVKQ